MMIQHQLYNEDVGDKDESLLSYSIKYFRCFLNVFVYHRNEILIDKVRIITFFFFFDHNKSNLLFEWQVIEVLWAKMMALAIAFVDWSHAVKYRINFNCARCQPSRFQKTLVYLYYHQIYQLWRFIFGRSNVQITWL
jgi:hypothetical protein